jgi:hypothetical protein
MKKSVAFINFSRENGKQVIDIKIDEDLEKLFKTESLDASNSYRDTDNEPIRFYTISETFDQYVNKFNMTYHSMVSEAQPNIPNPVTLSNYGSNLFKNGRFNFSILRTKDISRGKKIVVDDLIIDTDVNCWIEALAKFVKYLYQNFVQKLEVKAVINLEL